ncbi:hypothetical protein E4U13_007792 [Claviceps humidiphila]|uniref:Clock-controlled pheromone ccg-4 n=2 Tax=Claviceps TaxID=5110 RepID=A0A9P7SPC9_9HYPO|nr:hypothetical protein E4U57_002560 [Claviceps arundinis]KAG5968696.1 hypothetical protein E4U56_000301 [Claviceps arundinis]KAG6055946.1 hypothetical protein E4U32_005983 [Claviceps aff. humidiphila group G2b]KAG6105645.1 hypothetical protein E4U13_007792 [Claviceps humidiphila]
MHVTSIVIALVASGAFAAPSPEPQPWCWRPGQGCWKVKRAADAFAEAIQSSSSIVARAPETENGNSARALNELAHLVALTARDPSEFYDGLGLEKKSVDVDATKAARAVLDEIRDVSHEEESSAAPPSPHTFPPECEGPRVLCWKKREADPEPWCWRPGQGCWKAKRDLHALEVAARAIIEA